MTNMGDASNVDCKASRAKRCYGKSKNPTLRLKIASHDVDIFISIQIRKILVSKFQSFGYTREKLP